MPMQSRVILLPSLHVGQAAVCGVGEEFESEDNVTEISELRVTETDFRLFAGEVFRNEIVSKRKSYLPAQLERKQRKRENKQEVITNGGTRGGKTRTTEGNGRRD